MLDLVVRHAVVAGKYKEFVNYYAYHRVECYFKKIGLRETRLTVTLEQMIQTISKTIRLIV